MDVPGARQRRRLKRRSGRDDLIPRGPVARPLALVISALTATCVVAVIVLFTLGGLTDDRIAGTLVIPAALLLIADAYLWSRLSDDAHPIRHPVRFVRARWQARTPHRVSASARGLRARSRRNP